MDNKIAFASGAVGNIGRGEKDRSRAGKQRSEVTKGSDGSWWQKIREEAERNGGMKGFALYNRETVWPR